MAPSGLLSYLHRKVQALAVAGFERRLAPVLTHSPASRSLATTTRGWRRDLSPSCSSHAVSFFPRERSSLLPLSSVSLLSTSRLCVSRACSREWAEVFSYSGSVQKENRCHVSGAASAPLSGSAGPAVKAGDKGHKGAPASEESNEKPQATQKPLVAPGFERPVGLWLLGCSGLIFGLVCWGGYTRLTRSGLSMTQWSFQGKQLPQTEEEWEDEFNRYKMTPEYKQVHYGITLEQFQQIYFIEWFHRMFARTTGLAFVAGTVGFALAGALTSRMALRLAGMGILGGAQGLVGWWMVKSGFSEPTTENKMPRVSPYRLAFHLVTAMCLYSIVLWHALSLLYPPATTVSMAVAPAVAGAALRKLRSRAWGMAAIIGTTLCSGAFVAGNDAGRAYNTWPKMLDHWVPPEVYEVKNKFIKVFESTPVVQFDHRMLAYATLIGSGLLYFTGRRLPVPKEVNVAMGALHGTAALQLLLGITTLLCLVPTELGVLHQAGGMATLSAMVYLLQTISRASRSLPK